MKADALLHTFIWSLVTIASYGMARAIYRRKPKWWLMPLATTPLIIAITLVICAVPYPTYHDATRWLGWMLGPAVTALASPIYDQRALVMRHWRALLLGMLAGSCTAILSGWCLATMLGIGGSLRLTLLPRSISTPFAMELSRVLGGVPELTATFVVVTGVLGAVMGEVVLARRWFDSALSNGLMFGVGAHPGGTAHSHRLDSTVGAIAGLAMVLTGVLNLLLAPLIVGAVRAAG